MCEEERRASREEEEEKVVKVIGSSLLSVRLANLLGLPLAKQPPVNLKAVGRDTALIRLNSLVLFFRGANSGVSRIQSERVIKTDRSRLRAENQCHKLRSRVL